MKEVFEIPIEEAHPISLTTYFTNVTNHNNTDEFEEMFGKRTMTLEEIEEFLNSESMRQEIQTTFTLDSKTNATCTLQY